VVLKILINLNNHKNLRSIFLLLGIVFASCAQPEKIQQQEPTNMQTTVEQQLPANMDTATFGNGCFWCTEAVFQNLKGVYSAVSGYSGGHVKNPTYKDVCAGTTGHAEVLQIVYDPAVISFEELLEVFWKTHDPTTLNRQGNDIGTQYRSSIFYHNEQQKQLAEGYKKKLDASGAFAKPIVTEIVAFTEFYRAENYHQDYYSLNGTEPYCTYVIQPKVEKFKEVFKDKLK
jgi:peptide-methionine (S)-S-oxide reductase